MIYDERARMVLWDYVPNKSSRKDIIQAMKENLELAEHTDVTEFTFSINKPYTKKVIGEGPYSDSFTYTLLPDFTGMTEAQARALASKYGVSVSFSGSGGTVIDQSEPVKRRVDLIKGSVTLKLSGSKKEEKKEEKKETKKDDDDEKEKDKDKDKDEGGSSSGDSGTGDSGDSSGDSDSGDNKDDKKE